MRIYRVMTSLIGAIGFILLGTTAHAAVLFSDDFNHGQFSTINFTGLANWSVTDGTVDAFLNSGFGLPCPSLGCLDMDGSSNNAGKIQTDQVFNLAMGDYVVSLNVAGNQRGQAADTMDVFFGGTLLQSITLNASDPYSLIDIPFSVLASSNSGSLVLDHAGGDNFGILLDYVELRSVEDNGNGNGQTPVPATLALLGLGLVGIGYQRRKQIKAA